MKKLLLIGTAAALMLMAGCTRIVTGSVGIQEGYTGHISDQVVGQGMHLAVLTSYIPIDTTMTRAEVTGLRPKDSNGVMLKDVNVVVSYTLDPDRVAKFYRHTKELDEEAGGDYYTLGMNILKSSIIPQAVQYATEQSDLNDIAAHQPQYAATIEARVNALLNQLYPGIDPFQIVSVTVPTFRLPDSIQKQMDAQAGYKAEQETLKSKMQLIQRRKALVTAETEVDADALAQASKESGLTPVQIIDWKRAEALQALASSKAGVLVNVK